MAASVPRGAGGPAARRAGLARGAGHGLVRLGRWLFDPAKVNQAFFRAEMTWPAFGLHAAFSLLFGALLLIEPLSAFLGVGVRLGLTLILANLIPYGLLFAWSRRRRGSSVPAVFMMAHLNLLLIAAFIVAAGQPLSPFWAFYFLYTGVLCNAFGFHPYFLLVVVAAGLAPGLAYGRSLSTGWVTAGLFAFLGGWQYAFLGLMVDRTRVLERQTSELALRRRQAQERARIAGEINLGLKEAVQRAHAAGARLPSLVTAGAGPALTSCLRETQRFLRQALGQVRQALWSLSAAPATLDEVLAHMTRCFGDLCQGTGVTLQTALPAPGATARAVTLSPLAKHQLFCGGLAALSAALERAELARVMLSVRCEDQQIWLTVEDDGRPRAKDGELAAALSERAAPLGGAARLQRTRTGGTSVCLELPLSAAGDPDGGGS